MACKLPAKVAVCMSSVRSSVIVDYYDADSIGQAYVCVSVPELATMSLLAIGGLAVLRRRKK